MPFFNPAFRSSLKSQYVHLIVGQLLMVSLTLNQTFLTLDLFKEALKDWAIAESFEIRYVKSDSTRVVAIC